MPDINLQAFADALPIHAEEGPYREVVGESALLEALCGVRKAQSGEVILDVLHRVFESLRLLDRHELTLGNWAFVSFPAYLLGRSLLETISTPGQALFDDDYWQQGGHQPDAVVEEQRRLLADFESRRVRLHPTKHAAPIRFVTVAWGVIRLGSQFLMVHREDKSRKDTKNYVFPGGRLNLNDLPPEDRCAKSLRALHKNKLKLPYGPVNTLSRELAEELRLRADVDYCATLYRTLKPYRKVEGPRNSHAYTEYRITIYSIKLSPEGEARLLDHVSQAQGMEWFNLNDLLAPRGTPDGNVAFIDALRDEFLKSLPDFLSSIPDSSGTPYRFTAESDAVDIPAVVGMSFRVGKTGKEKDHLVPLAVSELSMLNMLVVHARKLGLQPVEDHICLLGGGWAKLNSVEATNVAGSLTRKLAEAGLPLVQLVNVVYVRLAIDPGLVFFRETTFSYRLDGYELQLLLSATMTPWATSNNVRQAVQLDSTLKLTITQIQNNGKLWKGEKILEGKDFDREVREKIDKHLRPVGLRKLIRTEQEEYSIEVPLEKP